MRQAWGNGAIVQLAADIERRKAVGGVGGSRQGGLRLHEQVGHEIPVSNETRVFYCLQISCLKLCEVSPSSLITFGACKGPIITILLLLVLSPPASVVSGVREPAFVRLRLLLAELLPLVARFRPSSPSSTRLAVFLITRFIEF